MAETIVAACLVLTAIAYVLGLSWALNRVVQRKAAIIIARWCEKNGFKLVSATWTGLNSKGSPLLLWSTWYRPVYSIVVRDGKGDEHSAFIACGSYLLGVMAGKPVVVWKHSRERSAGS
jgi:hypothetical protein